MTTLSRTHRTAPCIVGEPPGASSSAGDGSCAATGAATPGPEWLRRTLHAGLRFRVDFHRCVPDRRPSAPTSCSRGPASPSLWTGVSGTAAASTGPATVQLRLLGAKIEINQTATASRTSPRARRMDRDTNLGARGAGRAAAASSGARRSGRERQGRGGQRRAERGGDCVGEAGRHSVADLPILGDAGPLESEADWEALQHRALLDREPPEAIRRHGQRPTAVGEVAVIFDDPRLGALVKLVLVNDRRRVAAHRSWQRLRRPIKIERATRPVEQQRPAMGRWSHHRLARRDDPRAGHGVITALPEPRQERQRRTHRKWAISRRRRRDRAGRAPSEACEEEHPLSRLGNPVVVPRSAASGAST